MPEMRRRRMDALKALKAVGHPTSVRKNHAQDVEDGITDLMTDLLHLCDHQGIDTAKMLERIKGHHEAETSGQD